MQASEDRLEFAAGDSNLYRYVHNSPLVFSDPTGHASFVESGIIVGAISGALVTPVLDTICLVMVGEGDQISVTRVARKFASGAALGAAAGGLIAYAGVQLGAAGYFASTSGGLAGNALRRFVENLVNNGQVLIKPPKIGLTLLGVKVAGTENCDFLEFAAGL